MNEAAIDQIAAQVIASLKRGERLPAAALTLLVRLYAITGSEAISGVLEVALSQVLDDPGDDRLAVAARVVLLSEATAISDDERLPSAIAHLAALLRSAWPDRGPFVPAIASVDAFLVASPLFDDPGATRDAIDELERLMANAYEPGEGLLRTPPMGRPGTHADHVVAARTLLSAYEITGRIPYAMLAEELMRAVRPGLIGSLVPSPQPLVPSPQSLTPSPRSLAPTPGPLAPSPQSPAPSPDFDTVCEAARIFCRLDALHADPDYRSAAVIATGAHYAADAEHLLRSMAPLAAAHGPRAAIYALALGEWLGRTV